MKITNNLLENFSLKIASESQSVNLEPQSPRLSQIKSVKSLIRQQSRPVNELQAKKRSSKVNWERFSLHDESVELKEMSQNVIVIEEERRCKKLEYQYQMLKHLPEQISQGFSKLPISSRVSLKSVQEINLFTNYIACFKGLAFAQLTYLKYMDVSQNMISEIPYESINEHLVSLETLKVSSNQIKLLPYLKHVRHLEMMQNPLKKITAKLLNMNLVTLQIDWLHYLTFRTSESVNSQKSNLSQKQLSRINSQSKLSPTPTTPIQILKYQYLKKLNSNPQTAQDDYDFKALFKVKAHKIPTSTLEETVTQLLFHAIQNEHFFFVQFLLKHFTPLHYNKMNLYNKFLLEDVLKIRNTHFYDSVIKLFKPQKWPYPSPYPFVDNLFIAIRHSSIPFVKYLLQLGVAQKILSQTKQSIVQFLLTQYKESSQGVYIAGLVCLKIFQHLDSQNKKDRVEISLAKFPLIKSRVILNFWNFIARNQKLTPFILFTKRQTYHENSLLHFAIKSHEPQTAIQLVLSAQNHLDLFLKNSLGQSAKCEFAGDKFCKKVLWKLEKKYLDHHQELSHGNQTDIRLLDIQVGKILEVPYVKLSRIRTKKLKDIIKLLELDCPIVKEIVRNCLQNQYLETEQEAYFLLQQILQKLTKIISQLQPKHKTLSANEIFVILLKLFQTQIHDKRCYLASEIAKLLIKKKQDHFIFNLEDKAKEDLTKDQVNYTDDQLLVEYELMHSIPLLKTENFMVSSSAAKTSHFEENNSSMSIFSLSRFSCKKCD